MQSNLRFALGRLPQKSSMYVGLFLIFLAAPLFSLEEDPGVALSLETPVEEILAPSEKEEDVADAKSVFEDFFKEKKQEASDGYTINYTTVSIVEYLRFASKICKVNFIYDQAELNFTITIVSDEPVTAANVMATLIQVLRIHGLLLLEQDGNLVIHKSGGVRQIAKLVTEGSQEGNASIVTRIFRLKNATPESVSAIIQPMISSSAMIEVSSETRQLIITDITANVNKIAALIENLDSPHTTLEIQKYMSTHNPPDYLVDIGSQIMNPIAQGTPFILVPQNRSHEIFIVSTPEFAQKALDVFKSLDVPAKEKRGMKKLEDAYVYKIVSRSGPDLLKGLLDIKEHLKETDASETDLIETLSSAKWIQETNSIMLIGSSASIDKVKEFLAALDTSTEGEAISDQVSFFIYKPHNKSAEETRKAILEMASNLKDTKGISESFISTVQSVKVNPLTHTLSFTGPESDFPRVKELLITIDGSSDKRFSSGHDIPPSTQFLIYKPEHQTGEKLAESLQDVVKELKSDHLADPALLHALESLKWVKSTHSLLFTGDPDSLSKVQALIKTLDIPGLAEEEKRTFYQYHPKYADEKKTESYLKQVTLNLIKKGGSESLIQTLKSYKWIPESRTFMFYGPKKDLDQVGMLLSSFDTPDAEAKPQVKPGYFIYKVQHTTGDLIEEDLDNLAKNLKASGVKDTSVVDVIEKMRYVKQTNSLVLSGDPHGIEEAKQLIAQYDYPRSPQKPQGGSQFFIYKPQHLPAKQVEKSLRELATNLKGAGLADPNLLSSIENSKYVDSTNTLVFTGTPETLTKIQAMIKEVDLPPASHTPIQKVGKNTYLLYKLKNAGGPQIVSSIKNMTQELKKSGSVDKDFVSALSSMKYVQETHSLFFSGNEEALNKVKALVEQFDVTGLAPAKIKPVLPLSAAGDYFVYKPQSLPGTELETYLQNFADNLKSSGLEDQDLFRTISSIRWSEQTQTLVFTGTQKSIDQVKDLLKEFDVPSNLTEGLGKEPSIQAIDNTSFLVYKLQFHKGDEIQNALRQIAKDLMVTSAPINSGLLNSINSIQWLEVTNSLLCSGDQDTLTRLRELIKNLDIPLKQVFIEMLVVETTLTNALNFGLEWGANYKYRNKFGAGSYNSQPITTGNSASQWLQNLSALTPPAAPTPINNIPISSGFDLGVIGEVIKHNGQTFLTLGSLLTALQTDDESSIIMTPKILTQDGRTSTIFDGRNIPFVGSFVQNQGSNTVNTSNIEYRDVGLNLTVTPVLGNSDIVTLDINLDRTQTVGDATGTTNFNSSTATGITTSKTTMQTTVHVPDNNFLILSGMVNNSNTKSKAGIPCLGGLPWIGAAFSKNFDTITNSNIVIFIRPHIIHSMDEIRGITSHEEDYFRDQAGTPYLEKGFNEAMELIKTVDDD